MAERPQRNLALELVRATEAAAMVAARHMELGEREAANPAAARAMRLVLQTLEMDGVVVVGEGEKHSAPLLFHGEMVGTGRPPAVDVAVDPIEGTPVRALGRPNTLALAALAERWSLWDPGPSVYVDEIVVGGAARHAVALERGPAENLRCVAEALGCRVTDLTVFVLDKPRHVALIEAIRAAGARVRLNSGGFIVGALLAALPGTGVDVMMSIGRASEAVLAAAAVKSLSGALQIRRAPQSAEEQARVQAALGPHANQVLSENDLCKSDDAFFAATGISDGSLLRGVHFGRDGVTTESVVMRARSGTLRYVQAVHQLDKLMRFSQIDYTGAGQVAHN
jgi:fructose-1,6-bisphosphatase II